ncbi:MAG: baseplate multidomain protein megatron [Pseudomonadota bacterium]
MATILLSAAGAAIGGSVGGTVLGLSMATVGRFAGAMIGRSIDQRLMGGGSETVETGRVSRLRLTGAGEGDAIAQVYGRMRVAGQVIWATEFREKVRVIQGSSTESGGGGKGSAPPPPEEPTERVYRYFVSLAIALCEGEISHVGRVWADGHEIARDSLDMRVYRGTRGQRPDPTIEAVEGAGKVPAYRGTAYVVIESLGLRRFGNRVPQFTFEVMRPAPRDQPGAELDPPHGMRGVALLPGSGEYALATRRVRMDYGPGKGKVVNVNSPSGKTDFASSLESLQGELPQCRTTALIVSWFGRDLRCGVCKIRPRVEKKKYDSVNMPWMVCGQARGDAGRVARDDNGRPIYGGTPDDRSVIQAIRALRRAGQDVMYYPFILMDQKAGNGRPDPYSDAPDQPKLPWRGRITLSVAPGRPGSPDGTSQAEAEVAAFFGTARASDFSEVSDSDTDEPEGIVVPAGSPWDPNFFYEKESFTSAALNLIQPPKAKITSPVIYSGPDEWSYRRFVLHQAALCRAAGGVESFCIGSEMRGLTQIRGPGNSFPAVAQLISLTREVRKILGSGVKIGYAADWSEYAGYQPGNGDRFFHLDPLWAHDDIDFVGIDNYMPLSDWREGHDHLDAQDWDSIHDLGYLQSNIEGGEGYDWYYRTPEARAAQIRTPISDDAHGEPWVWRFKDIRNWWSHHHHDRVNGERADMPTPWIPQSKPIRFTEYGCAAIDKGTNQPNVFLDPKSSESHMPYHSDGQRDELIQLQYLRAMAGYWTDPANNPVSPIYEAEMVDWDHACAWAWDARPFPFFPDDQKLWSDGKNYARGHWLNGRMSARRLSSVVDEVTARAGLAHCDTRGLHGHLRGYLVDQVDAARGALQPLMLRYGFDAVERDGVLSFRLRDGRVDHRLDLECLARHPEMDGILEESRGNAAELAGRVRLRFVEADGDYAVLAEEAIMPDETSHAVSGSEMPLAMTRAEGRETVERWLSESRVATDGVRLCLPPSRLEAGAGDVIALPEQGGEGLFRIDRVEHLGQSQRIEAVRIEPETYRPAAFSGRAASAARSRAFAVPVTVTPFFLDLPLMSGAEVPHAPHLAVTADPWPGGAALYASDVDARYGLNRVVSSRAPVGITENALPAAQPGLIDRGEGLRVRMLSGALESVSNESLLGGANLCAIGDGTPDGWELFQFRDAELVDEDIYLLRNRLRGQLGTDAAMSGGWPGGSYVVRLDGSARQIALPEAKRGLVRFYRIGPADRGVDDPAYLGARLGFHGIGLRPLSPVHLRLSGAPGQDMTLSWIRRTRISGDRWEAPDVPLGEESETYVVRVMQGGAVLREEMTGQAEWTYGAEAQALDGVSGGFTLQVAQVSAHFGAGVFAALDVPG